MATLVDANFIPLSGAYLCADMIRYQDAEGVERERPCNAIGNQANQCPSCGSRHGLLSLAGLLDRPPASIVLSENIAGLYKAVDALEEALNGESC
jgi:hypothetical protein